MSVVELVDRALTGRAVVFGSLPPGGRDLDVLLRGGDVVGVPAALASAGLTSRGQIWASFTSCPPEVVEVRAVRSWGLPAQEEASLFAEAIALLDRRNLARPAPHHTLLILARRLMRSGELSTRQRRRAAEALAEDPAAAREAARRARAWGCERSLPMLIALLAGTAQPRYGERARALFGELRIRGRGPLRAGAGTAKVLLGRPSCGAVIAVSGLDGSGKSTQTALLESSLTALGYRTARVWPAVDAPSPAIRLLTRLGKGSVTRLVANRSRGGSTGSGQPDAARALRQRSEILTFAWTSLYAVRGASRVMRLVWPPWVRGRVVVCDRYLLDSHVFFWHNYGTSRRYGFQLGLLRLVSPRPHAAFLLEVPAAEASRRQPERSVEENEARASLYASAAAQLGVESVNGLAAPEAICAEVARRSWLAL